MQKKTFLFLIIFIIFLGVIGFFLVSKQTPIPKIDVEETNTPEFIPFSGEGLGGDISENNNPNLNNSVTINSPIRYSDFNSIDSKLSQVTSEPVAGYTIFSKIFEITEDPKELVSDSLVETYNFFDFDSLKIGNTGDGVSALQKVLNRIYPDSGIAAEGTFDTATKNAVINFQTENKLAADGIVGNGTKAKLNQYQGISTNPKDFEPIVRQEERFTIRYQNKRDGTIYDLGIDEKKFEAVPSLAFPGVQESFFGNNGNSVVIRYLNKDSIITYLGNFKKTSDGILSMEGDFLPTDIPFVSIGPDDTKLLYFEVGSRKSKGYIKDLLSGKTTTVFESRFTEWLPQFNGPEMFSLTTRASALASGYSYKYNANEKDSFEKGLGGLSGLTTNYNPSGTKVLYSTNNGGKSIETYVYDFNDKTNLTLGIKTLSEKCLWKDNDNLLCAAPRYITPEDYPDAWYKGEVSFEDVLWSIDTNNGLEKVVSNLKTNTSNTFDVVNPIFKNGILIFQNKKDYTLWMLDMR